MRKSDTWNKRNTHETIFIASVKSFRSIHAIRSTVEESVVHDDNMATEQQSIKKTEHFENREEKHA